MIETFTAANDNTPQDRSLEQRRDALIQSSAFVNSTREWIQERLNEIFVKEMAPADLEEVLAAFHGLQKNVDETEAAIDAAERDRTDVTLFEHAQRCGEELHSNFVFVEGIVESIE
jgi:hypothetical protein